MQKENNKYPARKRTRLKVYDYSINAYYFITICVNDKKEVFGNEKNNSVILNSYGRIIEKNLLDIPKRFNAVEIDYYIIMPNHFHGIFILDKSIDKPKKSISEVIGTFKSITYFVETRLALSALKRSYNAKKKIIGKDNPFS